HVLTFSRSSALFQCSAALRDLHSFPTRRSSDLLRRRPGPARRLARPRRSGSGTLAPLAAGLPRRSGRRGTRGGRLLARRLRLRRSEEHTSELQSRSDIVCRLLLEKKNKGREFKE